MGLPSKDAMLSLMQLTERTPETAQYLYERFEKVLKAEKSEVQFADLLKSLYQFAETVAKQFILLVNPFAGTRVPSPFENLEEATAAPAPKPTISGAKNIDMHVQISDDSTLERRYAINDQPIEPKTQGYLDGLFKRWIAKMGIVRKNHIMYEATATQEIIKDDAGMPVPVPPDALQEKLESPTEGINQFVSIQSKGTHQIQSLYVQRIPAFAPVAEPPQQSTVMGGGG